MTVPSPEVEEFLERLRGVRNSGSNWIACCPCRDDDDNPSLSIGQSKTGKVLVTCHRGAAACDFKQIITAAGLRPRHKVQPEKNDLKLVATYDYRDADGTLLFQKQRFVDREGKKTFRQRKPDDNGGWQYSLGDTPRVLYNLPETLKAVQDGVKVYVVEGEKDADTLINLGKVATTCPNGAGTWQSIHTQALVGAKVEIVADNDEPGLEHAEQVRQALIEAGCAVRMWRTPRGKDVSDFLGMGGNLAEMVRLDAEAPAVNNEVTAALQDIKNVFEDDGLSITQKVNRATSVLLGLAGEEKADEGRLVSWGDLVDEVESDQYDWVIPGLLERQERVIVVAAEGVGKSVLARQVAILTAHGVNPFSLSYMPPITTLYVDLENPERIIRRTGRPILSTVKEYSHCKEPNAHVVVKPSGFDLLKPSDQRVLEKHVQNVRPDILFMGPLYKAYIDGGGRTSESIAVEVVKFLDYLRDVYGCALWLEHHAPLGSSLSSRELRPFGSAVWSRWPEFGLALQPDPTATEGYVYNVDHFRGEREPRQWPLRMKRGTLFPFEVLEFREVK